MLIPRVLFAPHLPTLLVDEHRGHRTPMIDALHAAGERLRAGSPEAVVIVSGRWETAPPFLVDAGRRHHTVTDYHGFGVEVRFDCAGHPALARALVERGRKDGVRVEAGTRGVDSGASVPLHFLFPARDVKVVPLSVAREPRPNCRAWGASLRRALAAWRAPVAFVVGGVLSRSEHDWNLRREVPEADAYDARALEALARGDWEDLWRGSAKIHERAQPEGDLRHLEILRGVLGGDRPGRVLCREAGPGMGAVLVEFEADPEE